jgi:hypothetical protein
MAIIWLVRRALGSPLLSKTIGRRLGTVRGGLEDWYGNFAGSAVHKRQRNTFLAKMIIISIV